MSQNVEESIRTRMERVRRLSRENAESHEWYQAASLAQSVVHDTVGGGHPIMRALEQAVASGDWTKVLGACNGVIALYDDGALKSPRMQIAREIEGDLLEIAQAQAQSAEAAKDIAQKQVQLAVAAFLAGASLEDSLRRLCDAHGAPYDPQRSSIAKLQAALYQPSNQREVISQSENKQITAWGDTRNKADHGKFNAITQTEVIAMIMGTRAFIEKHLQ
jgi:hypothetical protein